MQLIQRILGEKRAKLGTFSSTCTLKSILRQKKNYGNSNISPCKNTIFKKALQKKPKSFKIGKFLIHTFFG
jgi:hypothetical protein